MEEGPRGHSPHPRAESHAVHTQHCTQPPACRNSVTHAQEAGFGGLFPLPPNASEKPHSRIFLTFLPPPQQAMAESPRSPECCLSLAASLLFPLAGPLPPGVTGWTLAAGADPSQTDTFISCVLGIKLLPGFCVPTSSTLFLRLYFKRICFYWKLRFTGRGRDKIRFLFVCFLVF